MAVAALLAFNQGAPKADAAAQAPPTTTALSVSTEPVAWATDYERRRIYTGRVAARRSADLGFERLGRLVRILVDDGEPVEQGDILAELDGRDLALQRREVDALRWQAIARLEELRAGPRKQTIRAARQQVEDLAAQLELSRRKRARAEKLLTRGTIGTEAFEEARFGAEALAARLAAARDRLDELEEGTRPEQIAAQAALVRQLDARIASIDLQIEKSVLRAPFAGRVGARLADEGRVVAAREPVVSLVESHALEARVGLPVHVALTPGRTHDLVVGGRTVVGTVRSALPRIDAASRTRTVVLDLAKGEHVVPGQIARLTVTESVPARGIWLPNTALVKSARGLWSVYVVRDGVVEKREVELIHTQSDRVLVRGTLSTGEHVVVAGTHRVVAGQRVIEE